MVAPWSSFDRYDLYLSVIPIVLGAAIFLHVLTGLPLTTTILPGAMIAIGAIGDAVFLRPPTHGDRGAI
ncbi:MAG: hypothetical protein ABEH64_06225 [Salinirussus sp.]